MLILLGLGVLWAAVLVPPLLRSRIAAAGPSPVANNESGQLDVYHPPALQRVTSLPPRSVRAAQRRRMDVLLVLVGASVFTLLGGFAVGGFVPWTAHFMTDLCWWATRHCSCSGSSRLAILRPLWCPYVPAWITPASPRHLTMPWSVAWPPD